MRYKHRQSNARAREKSRKHLARGNYARSGKAGKGYGCGTVWNKTENCRQKMGQKGDAGQGCKKRFLADEKHSGIYDERDEKHESRGLQGVENCGCKNAL